MESYTEEQAVEDRLSIRTLEELQQSDPTEEEVQDE